jgi:hypothetical protein
MSNVRKQQNYVRYGKKPTILQYIKYELYTELNLHDRKRVRLYGNMVHFLHLRIQLWSGDWFPFQRPGRRVHLWTFIMGCVYSSARMGEYVESSARLGTSRGLYYKLIT